MPLFSLNSIGRCSGLEHQGSVEGMGLLQVRMGLGLGEVAQWGKDMHEALS